MKRLSRIISLLAAATLALAGCAGMPSSRSGFLSDYQALTPQGNDGTAQALRPQQRIDPRLIEIAPPAWLDSAKDKLKPDEQAQLLALLRAALAARVAALPVPAGTMAGERLILRAAITRAELVNPTLNVLSTALLFAPLDRGGAAVEIELLDAQTRRPVAALVTAHCAPLSEFKARFSRLAPAELALGQAAEEFARLLASGV